MNGAGVHYQAFTLTDLCSQSTDANGDEVYCTIDHLIETDTADLAGSTRISRSTSSTSSTSFGIFWLDVNTHGQITTSIEAYASITVGSPGPAFVVDIQNAERVSNGNHRIYATIFIANDGLYFGSFQIKFSSQNKFKPSRSALCRISDANTFGTAQALGMIRESVTTTTSTS